ncbi:MAG TPA: hypothetical protein GXX63_02270 [Tissierellia bacterium]|nr:hypothetical protein [Tissierellia bacterium]
MIKLLRRHLLQNKELISLLSNNQSIYHMEKPLKYNDDTYIVLKDKLISGYFIEEYQLTFHIISSDMNKTVEIEKELISYLNDPRGEKLIRDNDTYIRNIQVLRGGGRIYNQDKDNWMSVVYFLCKI